ncbi:hypothetical protein [uncultured Jannaschia sp.]|uniref:hypothetical protein n=1 Tax=uncultured Jannaschia sp. TaxID=293347 RepID=UPI0026156A02|nr:hypothetical protein [uncultured Jannaschia sp.]
MTAFALEDFGSAMVQSSPLAEAAPGPFDEGYAAGWDDAVARLDEENGLLGARLQETLARLTESRAAAVDGLVAMLEPALRDIFDTFLPRAAQSAFLPILMQELTEVMADGDARPVLLVAPEEEPPLTRLIDQAELADRVTIRPEPALALSQAMIRWEGQERQVDLEAVLSDLDAALDTFLHGLLPGCANPPTDTTPKEANHG